MGRSPMRFADSRVRRVAHPPKQHVSDTGRSHTGTAGSSPTLPTSDRTTNSTTRLISQVLLPWVGIILSWFHLDPAVRADEVVPTGNTAEWIARELTEHREASLPRGDYRIDRPIVVSRFQRLELHGARITATHPGPAIVIDGRRATVVGNGARIIADQEHTQPMVHVVSGLRFKVEDIWITGKNKRQIGIQIDSPISQTGDPRSDTSYFGILRDVEINDVDTAILLAEQANGLYIENPLMWRIGSCFLRFRGAYGNRVIGGFAHGSGTSDGVTVVEFLRTATEHATASTHNQIIGFGAEPGGENSRPYRIETGCTDNQIIANFNVAGGGINEGDHNWGYRRGNRPLPCWNPCEALIASVRQFVHQRLHPCDEHPGHSRCNRFSPCGPHGFPFLQGTVIVVQATKSARLSINRHSILTGRFPRPNVA